MTATLGPLARRARSALCPPLVRCARLPLLGSSRARDALFGGRLSGTTPPFGQAVWRSPLGRQAFSGLVPWVPLGVSAGTSQDEVGSGHSTFAGLLSAGSGGDGVGSVVDLCVQRDAGESHVGFCLGAGGHVLCSDPGAGAAGRAFDCSSHGQLSCARFVGRLGGPPGECVGTVLGVVGACSGTRRRPQRVEIFEGPGPGGRLPLHTIEPRGGRRPRRVRPPRFHRHRRPPFAPLRTDSSEVRFGMDCQPRGAGVQPAALRLPHRRRGGRGRIRWRRPRVRGGCRFLFFGSSRGGFPARSGSGPPGRRGLDFGAQSQASRPAFRTEVPRRIGQQRVFSPRRAHCRGLGGARVSYGPAWGRPSL